MTRPRELHNGREFSIVKNFFDASYLAERFRAAGPAVDVRETETFFIYGVGQRVQGP